SRPHDQLSTESAIRSLVLSSIWNAVSPSLVPAVTRDPPICARLFDGERRALPRQINRSDAACSVAAGALSLPFSRAGLAGKATNAAVLRDQALSRPLLARSAAD